MITSEDFWPAFPDIPEEEIRDNIPSEIREKIPHLRHLYIQSRYALSLYLNNEAYTDLKNRREGKDVLLTAALFDLALAVEAYLAIVLNNICQSKIKVNQISNNIIELKENIVQENTRELFVQLEEMKCFYKAKNLGSATCRLNSFRNKFIGHDSLLPTSEIVFPKMGEFHDLVVYNFNSCAIIIAICTRRIIDIEQIVKTAERKKEVLIELMKN